MSWDEKLTKQAKKIVKLYPQKRSALGPLLHLAQSKDGYISDDSVSVISELVGITEVQVKSVSTFLLDVQTRANRKIFIECL
jgi:NADH-quinone oxidoreductase subunit E